ncbi:hypothetical protein IMZ48_44210 [Candidatus Bathyarchaeota archaeon]|nr:hypothetical protein [Candidatus Bathyarchaeota archaeon]
MLAPELYGSGLAIARLTLDCDGVVRSCLEGGLAYFHSSLSDDSKSVLATAGDSATGRRPSLVCPRHGSCMVTTRSTCRGRQLGDRGACCRHQGVREVVDVCEGGVLRPFGSPRRVRGLPVSDGFESPDAVSRLKSWNAVARGKRAAGSSYYQQI